MEKQKKVYSFRVKDELVSDLKKIAKKENRTVSNLIETTLFDFVKQKGYGNAKV